MHNTLRQHCRAPKAKGLCSITADGKDVEVFVDYPESIHYLSYTSTLR